MVIDKSKGRWCVESNELDDLSYQLFINNWREFYGDRVDNSIYNEQSVLMLGYSKDTQGGVYFKYYDNAKLILRKEKIEKIKGRYGNR